MTTVIADRGYELREVDVPALPPKELASLARFFQAMQAERFPDDPPQPLDLVARRIRNRPAVMHQRDWLARVGGEVVGAAQLTRWENESNLHWRDAWVGVRAGHRGRGTGRALLRSLVAACDDDEIVIGSWANDRVPAGGKFAAQIGAKPGLENRLSEVRIEHIDRALVEEWTHLDPAGYRMVWIDGDVPEELMPNVIVAYDTMNTAPRGDLAFGDWRTTADEVRDWDRIRSANGAKRRLVLAIHEATGEAAGFTEVVRHPAMAWLVNQQGTAVVPAHRGRGIGKWIKGAMIERILGEWPEARVVRTGNAYSNAPMISINDRLGFKVILSTTVWQAALADIRGYLEARPA